MNYLVLTVRFLDDRYHGLLDRGGPPEWPPSPYRLMQALVAGVARRGELVVGEDTLDNTNFTDIGNAIAWLQKLAPPIIIAPPAKRGQAITRFVPNNDGDKKFDRQERLTAKPTIPTLFLLEPDQQPEVHYVWDVADSDEVPLERIRDAARSLTSLGWGIDMAFADAKRADESSLQLLTGVRWYPKPNVWRNDGMLRTPTYNNQTKECTLYDLRRCHHSAINRIEHGNPLRTVEKPTLFDRVLYASTERPIGRPCAVFRLLDENDDTVSYSQAKLIHIAGMVRHLAIRRMSDNPPRDLRGQTPEQWVEQYVAGHQDKSAAADSSHTQLSYIPLQSLGTPHTDPSVRRVMIVAPVGDDDWLEHLARHLDGRRLKPETDTRLPSGTRLERIADSRKDGVRDAYLDAARTWASVTPVILPGHDDHKPAKTHKLIQKALAQAGIEQPCEFDWSAFSHFRKMFSAHKYVRDSSAKDGKRQINYTRPDHLQHLTAVHVRLQFDNDVCGPLAIGAGRHCGFGVLANISGSV